MIFRLTQKLAKKIDAVDSLNTLPLDTNPFVDWSVHLFRAQRVQYIILINTSSLYSIVMYGRGITDNNNFINCSLSTMRDFLYADGNEFIYRRFIEPGMYPVMFAKSLNPAVTGSLNELVYQAKCIIEFKETSPLGVSYKLNEIPMSYLKNMHPRKVFRAMKMK